MFLSKEREVEMCCSFGEFERDDMWTAERGKLTIKLRIDRSLPLLSCAINGRSVLMATKEADKTIISIAFTRCLALSFITKHYQQHLPE